MKIKGKSKKRIHGLTKYIIATCNRASSRYDFVPEYTYLLPEELVDEFVKKGGEIVL